MTQKPDLNPPSTSLTFLTRDLRVALVAALVAAAACALLFLSALGPRPGQPSSGASEPVWVFLLAIALFLFPYVVCNLLLRSNMFDSIAGGAGVACALFGAFLVATPFLIKGMWLLLVLTAWHGMDSWVAAADLSMMIFMAISFWVVRSAIKISKHRARPFFVAFVTTAIYICLGFYAFTVAAVRGPLEAENQRRERDANASMPGVLARQQIHSLTACLQQNHMLHPEAPFPASLDAPPAGWDCAIKFRRDAVAGFTFSYTPQTDATGKALDFQLVAIPNDVARHPMGERASVNVPMMTDRRGILFAYSPWGLENVTPLIRIPSNDRFYSQIDALRANVLKYTNSQDGGVVPSALNTQSMGSLLHEIPSIEDGGLRLETRDFTILYLPPDTAHPSQFALSARCKTYAQNCIRSYFADYDGVVHATGEPRQATAGDPLSDRCEVGFSSCDDVVWLGTDK